MVYYDSEIYLNWFFFMSVIVVYKMKSIEMIDLVVHDATNLKVLRFAWFLTTIYLGDSCFLCAVQKGYHFPKTKNGNHRILYKSLFLYLIIK